MEWEWNEPPIGKHDGSVWKKAYSDDVIGLDGDGQPHLVFYDHQYKNWNGAETQVPIAEKILCWIELPADFLKEDKPTG